MRKIIITCSLILLLLAVFMVATSSKGNSSKAQEEEVFAIEIYHCTTCGFRSKAEDAASALKKEYGVEADIQIGDPGSFEVYVNDELIFSRLEEGRFPSNEELIELITERY